MLSSDNLEQAHVSVNVKDYVALHPFTPNIKEGLTFFKNALMHEGGINGLPITCYWFTLEAKATLKVDHEPVIILSQKFGLESDLTKGRDEIAKASRSWDRLHCLLEDAFRPATIETGGPSQHHTEAHLWLKIKLPQKLLLHEKCPLQLICKLGY